MKTVEINQSGQKLNEAYHELLDKISDHVQVLAMHDEPIDGIMTAKRGLYKLKEQLEIRSKDGTSSKIRTRRMNQRMMWLIEETQQKLGLDALEAVKVGMVGEDDLKRVLIQHEYVEMAKQGMKYKEIKEVLSLKYDWSVSRIEKLVYRGGC
jgi:hypothetical protein